MRKHVVTLKHVAEEAGVSVPTTSTVLNSAGGNTVVSDETRQRILAAACKLGYQPNYHAQALKRGCSQAIGLLLDPPTHGEAGEAWLREMARGAEYRARERGYDFVVIGPVQDTPVLERGSTRAEQGGLDVLLALGGKPSLRNFKSSSVRVPFVLLGDDRYETGIPYVAVDETPGVNAVVDHLAQLGHRKLLWLSLAVESGEPAPIRLAALHAAAGRHCISVKELRVAPAVGINRPTLAATISQYRIVAAESLSALAGHTAIVCYNELLAMGVMQALWEAGRRLPYDVSIIGFDDIHAGLAHPALTAVSLELPAIGARAVDLALKMRGEPRLMTRMRGACEKIPARLILRGSTAPAASRFSNS